MDYELRRNLEEISLSLNERFNEARRELKGDISELDTQLLEAIAKLNRRIEFLEARISKLEDNSAWNLLVEQAEKLNITPEQLLKRAVTNYMRKEGKRLR